jgi:CRISPR/Cas system endoribonuclease Cas6 (RAMP superfamily)
MREAEKQFCRRVGIGNGNRHNFVNSWSQLAVKHPSSRESSLELNKTLTASQPWFKKNTTFLASAFVKVANNKKYWNQWLVVDV